MPACRTVSKHNVSQWASSQFVWKCVCDCFFFFFFAKFLFAGLFFPNFNTRGSCYSLEAVRISMTLNFQMTVLSTTPTFAYISFKYCTCPWLRPKFNLARRVIQRDDSGALGSFSQSCDRVCRLIKACVETYKMTHSEKQTAQN